MTYLKLYLISLVIITLLDIFWIGFVMSNFFNEELGDIARREGNKLSPLWVPGGLVYLLLALAPTFFVFPKYFDKPFDPGIFFWGAFLGLIIYGVYELTNYAIIKGWSWRFVFVDILWGAFLIGFTSAIGGLLARWFKTF